MPVTARRLLVRNINGSGKKGPNYSYDPVSGRSTRSGCGVCPPPPPPPPIVVGVGSGENTLLYSLDDGLTWIGLGNSIFTEKGTCAVWNGNIWVASGYGTNPIAYSYDGINWTGVGPISTGISSDISTCNSVVWTGSKFVGVVLDVAITSLDGINWIGFSNVTSNLMQNSLATSGNSIVSIPYDISTQMGYTDNSTNIIGEAWIPVIDTSGSLNAEQILEYTDILWNGSKFIVTVGNRLSPNNSKFYSTDAFTWTPIPNVGYVNGYNIGVNKSKTIYISRGKDPNTTERSTDGINWSIISDPVLDAFTFTQGITGSIFSTQKYIIICGMIDNSFIYSTDGLSWKLSNTNVSGTFSAGFSK
jgi:hypothetical protein